MGRYTIGLVGESKYQSEVRHLVRRQVIELVPEPSNKSDPRAIKAVTLAGEIIGYIERESWITRLIIDENGEIFAAVKEVVGGSKGKRAVGVVLDIYTAKDALEARAKAESDFAKKRQGCLGSVVVVLTTFGSIGLFSNWLF